MLQVYSTFDVDGQGNVDWRCMVFMLRVAVNAQVCGWIQQDHTSLPVLEVNRLSGANSIRRPTEFALLFIGDTWPQTACMSSNLGREGIASNWTPVQNRPTLTRLRRKGLAKCG